MMDGGQIQTLIRAAVWKRIRVRDWRSFASNESVEFSGAQDGPREKSDGSLRNILGSGLAAALGPCAGVPGPFAEGACVKV